MKKKFEINYFWFFVVFIFIFLTLIKPINTVPEFSENRIYLPMFGFIFIMIGLGKIKIPTFIKKKNK